MKILNTWQGNCQIAADPQGKETQNSYIGKFWLKVPGPKMAFFYIGMTVWGEAGRNAVQRFHKGSDIHVEGRININKYTDKNGVEKSTTEIVGTEIRDYQEWLLDQEPDRSKVNEAPELTYGHGWVQPALGVTPIEDEVPF